MVVEEVEEEEEGRWRLQGEVEGKEGKEGKEGGALVLFKKAGDFRNEYGIALRNLGAKL